MRFKYLKFLVVMLCVILLSLSDTAAETELVDILILNSYHDGYQWSDDTKRGINDVLSSLDSEYYLRIEHMDTKNISSDVYLEELFKMYQFKYDMDEFDIIISADDNALMFLLRYRESLFADTPIFFCGVNDISAHDLSNVTNVYGVQEKHSIATTAAVALKQNPSLKNVYLVVDDTITGRSTKVDARKDMAIYEGILNFEIIENMSYKEILETVSHFDPKDTIVMQSFFVVDEDGTSYPLEYTAKQLADYSSVPVYAIFSFGFGEGTVGGQFVEGYTQGSRVALMVMDYLEDGVYDGEQYIIDESFNRYHFDYEVMERFHLDVNVLPEDRYIINKPVSFYQRNKTLINIGLVVLSLLLIYVYILKRQLNKQTKRITHTQKQLMESEKMASLGRLVAGVAHEVNTPIGIGVTLSSYIDDETTKVQKMLEDKKLTQTQLSDFLEDIQMSSEMMTGTMNRASDLIQSFKQVAVDQSYDIQREVNLCDHLNDVVSSLKSELKRKTIDISVNCDEQLIIYSHAGAIYQIILNLIMNAIKHGFHNLDEGKIELKAYKTKMGLTANKADAVCITFKDNGVGIKPSEVKKIFEPFYTTKRSEGGSGLGLHIVYNLVTQRLLGTIECDSVVDSYTEFKITFPLEENVKKVKSVLE